VSNEVISQPERRAPPTPNDSKAPAEELAERLKLLSDFTRLQLATTLTKVFEDLARRDPDEIFKRSHEVLDSRRLPISFMGGHGISLMFGIDFQRALFREP